MNKKIIVSKGVVDSIEWLKNSKINIDEFLKILDGTTKVKDLRDELQELMKLDNEIIYKILFNGYEVEKQELPDIFKFKIDNTKTIFQAYKIKNKVIVSWCYNNRLESVDYEINSCLEYINNGSWILID